MSIVLKKSSSVVATSVIATSNGLTTGLIPSTADFVVATNATDANDIITLPVPVVGKDIFVFASEACEVRTPATSGNTINGVDSDGTNEAALVAGSCARFIAVTTTGWHAEYWIANGTPTVLIPDNL